MRKHHRETIRYLQRAGATRVEFVPTSKHPRICIDRAGRPAQLCHVLLAGNIERAIVNVTHDLDRIMKRIQQ
jgi:hypothetical protein